ncbi:MAG: UPF0182 family protein, partial [Candidatus Binatia bacterium]
MSRLALPLAIAGVLAFVLVGAGSGLIVDALWFRQLGYFVVFRTALAAKIATFLLGAAVASTALVTVGLYVLGHIRERGHVRVVIRRGNGPETLPELIAPFAERIPWRGLVVAAAAVVGFLFGLGQSANWETYLLALYGGAYGAVDPLFGLDIGFYLFSLPAYRAVVNAAIGIIILCGLLAAALFWLQGALDFRRPGDLLPPAAIRLASLLLGLLLLVKSADYFLGRYELLLAPYGAVFGPGYTASNVRLPLQWLLSFAALIGAGLALANWRFGGWRLPVTGVVMVFAASILSGVIPGVFQRLRVRPDELRLEQPYLQRNIEMTRIAYGLDRIETRPFPAKTPLDAAAIARNRQTFDNIRLWDPGPLLDTYRQLQLIRLYY